MLITWRSSFKPFIGEQTSKPGKMIKSRSKVKKTIRQIIQEEQIFYA